MGKRNKRVKKGLESIQKQLEAIEEGKIELVDYYEREIKGLKKSKENKEDILDK